MFLFNKNPKPSTYLVYLLGVFTAGSMCSSFATSFATSFILSLTGEFGWLKIDQHLGETPASLFDQITYTIRSGILCGNKYVNDQISFVVYNN